MLSIYIIIMLYNQASAAQNNTRKHFIFCLVDYIVKIVKLNKHMEKKGGRRRGNKKRGLANSCWEVSSLAWCPHPPVLWPLLVIIPTSHSPKPARVTSYVSERYWWLPSSKSGHFTPIWCPQINVHTSHLHPLSSSLSLSLLHDSNGSPPIQAPLIHLHF